jgi:hypothetical protein
MLLNSAVYCIPCFSGVMSYPDTLLNQNNRFAFAYFVPTLCRRPDTTQRKKGNGRTQVRGRQPRWEGVPSICPCVSVQSMSSVPQHLVSPCPFQPLPAHLIDIRVLYVSAIDGSFDLSACWISPSNLSIRFSLAGHPLVWLNSQVLESVPI